MLAMGWRLWWDVVALVAICGGVGVCFTAGVFWFGFLVGVYCPGLVTFLVYRLLWVVCVVCWFRGVFVLGELWFWVIISCGFRLWVL